MKQLKQILVDAITAHPDFKVRFVASNITPTNGLMGGEICDVIVNKTHRTIYVWCFKEVSV